MRLTWVIQGAGIGSAEVVDTEAAAKALSDAVRAATERHGPDVQAQVLGTVVGPLRAALVTDGRYAVERGDSWTRVLGSVMLTLEP